MARTNILGRRTLLALGAGAALTAAVAPSAHAATRDVFAGLEQEYAARLGVFAHDTATGRTLTHRADERFPMCSVFKAPAAAAVLREGVDLTRRIHYTQQELTDSGYAPVTEKHLDTGMTVEELCAAAVSHSDNAAANFLLRELGGPTAITRFARSLGDPVTRLDRWEPDLNSAEPWRKTDTTTPHAIARTYAKFLLGDVLPPADRTRLTSWMIANSTNTTRFRAGLPADWILADKTGGGSSYGVANDVGVVWPPGRPPLVIAVLTTTYAAEGPSKNELVARAAELVAAELT
ncbi:class A beta-lactamase [Streptomyces acidiscabies]|uniref:Beta-lactamase n=1 Tax=Streptomyces acidiscabies TaxID=42234 RepID=A0A0L0JDA4_9ACTN|nr:class A beta-lactamase [Streptomyces acidiscabies]KND23335.1 beta-lactamase [Streptomyces acidiscabies]